MLEAVLEAEGERISCCSPRPSHVCLEKVKRVRGMKELRPQIRLELEGKGPPCDVHVLERVQSKTPPEERSKERL